METIDLSDDDETFKKTYGRQNYIQYRKLINTREKILKENANINFYHKNSVSLITEAKKFDLIVANLLLNSILKLCRDFYLSLSNGGIIIVSGILENQQQYVISIYRKFKFRLIKRKYFEGWVSIIFKKV